MENSLQREITSIWNSDLIRRVKPTPIDEAKGGLAVVEQVGKMLAARFSSSGYEDGAIGPAHGLST